VGEFTAIVVFFIDCRRLAIGSVFVQWPLDADR